MAYVWRVFIAIGAGVVAAVIVYSTTPPTEIAEVESAVILSDARTLEVRGIFDQGLTNKEWPDSAEVHVWPNEEFDELIVWVTVERHYPRYSTLSQCLEHIATRVESPAPVVAGIGTFAGPATVSREGCREIFTTVLAEPLDPTTPVRVLRPGREPPVPVVQVRVEKTAAVGILTAIVVLPFLLLARRPTRIEDAPLDGFVTGFD